MGRALRAWIGQKQWKNVFTILALIALWNIFAAYAQDDISSSLIAELRSGNAELRDATEIASNVAIAIASEASGDDGVPVGLGFTVPYGKDANDRKLILVRYASDDSAMDFQSTLKAAGASILEIVGVNTVLMQAGPAAISLAASFQALAAEYPPALKLSPEILAVFKAAAASAKASQQRRRQLATGGGSNTGTSSVRGNTAGMTGSTDSSSSSLPPRGSGPSQTSVAALNALSTWSSYVDLTQSRAPPPSFPPVVGFNLSSPPSARATTFELFAASIKLVPELPDETRNAIATAWPRALGDYLGRLGRGDPCQPQAVTEGLFSKTVPILIMYFCAQDYEKGVTLLASLDRVMWAEPALMATSRSAVAGWITQTGNITADNFDNPTANLRPYWRAQLRGQGIVVGLEDSGVDMSHCSFIDDDWRTGSLRSLFTGSPPRLYLPNHRKVVQYMLPVRSGINRWFGDEPYGHGTHVAGIIAGSKYTDKNKVPPDGFVDERSTGSAPLARLSVFDISPDNALYIPSSVDDMMLPYHYAVGARIGSSSWGFGSSLAVTYNEVCRQYDAFAWRNPEFVSVIAAGNDGDNGFMPTVTAPATAKNVISVGSTLNHPRDFAASGYNQAILFRYRDANGTLQSYSMWPYLGTSDTRWRSLLSREVPFRVASPLGACSTLSGANYTGAVVLVELAMSSSATCSGNQRAVNARAAGALAIMFIAAGNGFLDGSQDVPIINDANTVFALTTRASGLATVNLLRNATLNITNPHMIFLTYPNINVGLDTVSYFSSYGPFIDGRFKPDIVAPGGLIESAASGPGISSDSTGDTCSSESTLKQGTSMAAPVVSGHLVLIRQYFRDGYYPTGSPNDPASVALEPSGMLVKAVALVGARSLAGGFAANAGFRLGAAPDGFQGWGRMDLSGSLPLPGTSHPMFRMSIADYGVINPGDWIYMSGVEATGTGPITAALVWHDYPGSSAAKKTLINDLDFGYQLNGGPYSRTRPDSVNNVERVELPNLAAGDKITFVVQGRNIRHRLLTGPDAQLPQRWAVIVVGHFNGTLRTQYNPAYLRPQRFATDTQITLGFPAGTCFISRADATTVTNGACSLASANFTLVEEAIAQAPPMDPQVGPRIISDGGFWYYLRDYLGRCVTVPSNASSTRVTVASCNSSDSRQKFGLFRSYVRDGPFYHIVPSFAIRSGGSARCLRQSSSSFLLLASCNNTDPDQMVEFRPPPTGRMERALPPSPQPPLPSPQAPVEQWYPYSLVFRVDWYPTEGRFNLNDYDYVANNNGYGDETYGDVTDDLDIIVSWTWQNMTYSVGRYVSGSNNGSIAPGVMYGGDNTYYGTQYEIVFFQVGTTPPPAQFHVCVAWQFSQTPLMRTVMTVYQGYEVASYERNIDTYLTSDSFCNPNAAGYIATYDAAAPAQPSPPSPPAAPPQPQPLFPLYFRADWNVLSGVRGRPTKTFDFDIVVSWNNGGQNFSIGAFSTGPVGGALHGGDNLHNNGSNYEEVYWPVGTSLPPTNTYDICLRWNSVNAKPLALVKLTVWYNDRLTTSSVTLDTTYEWSDVCAPGAVGYIDSYWVGETRGLPDDLSYGCLMTPPPSAAMSLYFLAQWNTINTTGTVFDWDLVVAWHWGGQAFELSPYVRFIGGAVHGGDNMRLSIPQNSEAAYWPTALTGLEPNPVQYDVCVRWYKAGRLNVTLTVVQYNNVVMRISRVVDGGSVNNKTCRPLAVGYIGSYNYTGSGAAGGAALGGFTGRRSLMEELVDGDDVATAAASNGALSIEDLTNMALMS